MGLITAADVVLTLSVLPILPVQQIQGFATDEVLDIPQIKSAEVMMGVDGIQSSGFVYVSIPHTITLQADSLSNRFFDNWWAQMQGGKTAYIANGNIKMPSVATKYALTSGILTGYKPLANVKRVLQSRTYEITWQTIAAAPN